MQELEKILEEIDNLYVDETDFGIECNMENRSDVACDNCYECIKEACKNIIRKHMNDSKCGNCSRRKWYQIGYKDRKNDGWIPVEERLPEVDADIEETIEDDDCPEYNVTIRGALESTTLKYSPDGVWFDDNGNVYDVIAWRPLPEPYRPERSTE